MDRFTRNYAIGLAIAVAALVAIWIASAWHPRVRVLNQLLQADPYLSAYPYHFRVLSLEHGIATMSTPRSFDFPVIRFLAIIHPELARAAPDDPQMMAAQQDLVNHQKKAQALISRQPDVKAVRWQLDTEWLSNHGVRLPGGLLAPKVASAHRAREALLDCDFRDAEPCSALMLPAVPASFRIDECCQGARLLRVFRTRSASGWNHAKSGCAGLNTAEI
jgi:hypothetical protein